VKRVHSLAFFRNDHSGYETAAAGEGRGRFFIGMLSTVIRAHRHVWDGWELRIHHDDRVREYPEWDAIERLAQEQFLSLVYVGKSETLCGSMLWRMKPMFDPSVEWFVCRDVDSLPMHRDRVMVDQAIAEGGWVHVIHDSESHSGLMGGMSAFYAPGLRKAFPGVASLEQFMALIDGEYKMAGPDAGPFNWNDHGADQTFLNRVVWRNTARRAVVHQRKRQVVHREAQRTLPVAPQVTELDMVIRHIGAAFNVPKAEEALDRALAGEVER